MRDNIEKYEKKGKTYYRFKVYTGINPKTGKKTNTTRSGFPTLASAKKARAKIIAEVQEGTYWEERNQDAPETLGELIDEYMKLKKGSIKPSTFQGMEYQFKKFDDIKNYQLKSLATIDIQKVLDSSGVSVGRKNLLLNRLKSVLNYALKQGYIKRNVAEVIQTFKDFSVEKNEKKKFYNEEELRLFLKVLKEENFKYYVMARLQAFGGLRIGEVLALTLKDVDFENQTISINKTVTKSGDTSILTTPKTSASIRVVTIDQYTINALQEWCNLNHVNYLIFEIARDKIPAVSSVITFYLKFFKRHKELKKISSHALRHTHASLLFKEGVNPKVIQKRLGHSTLEMTMNVYTHLFEDVEEDENIKIMNKLNDFKDS